MMWNQVSVAVSQRKERMGHIPQHERERLLVSAGMDRARLAAGEAAPADVQERFEELVAKRNAGVPLQYLEGTVQFGPVEVAVDARALIPRPETEVLWEDAVKSLGDAGPGTVIVDLCSGSGNLALALKKAFPAARVIGTDSSEDALALAEENSQRSGLEVEWLKGDLFDALPTKLKGRIDVLVANPPYVSEVEFAALPEEIRAHEPRSALVAGPVGTEILARIADEAYWWLGVGGWLFVEIGETQGEVAMGLFGGLDREVRQDLAGRDRYLVGRRGASCCL